MANIQDILDFWFEGITDATPIKKNTHPFKKWFAKNDKFDQEIREKFKEDLIKARQGDYKNWELSVDGRLALIVLFDQFSRNMYRDTPQMYETDTLALELASRSIKENIDKKSALIERVFIYMPLEHAEDLKMQELSLRCFDGLVHEAKQKNPRNAAYYQSHFDYARRHYDIIAHFGRFPHRNAILNRTPTPKEADFLKNTRSSF